MTTFSALVVSKSDDGQFVRAITTREIDDLPEGDVLVKVAYSSLNYKDALSATGNPGVTRNFPHTPGVDAAGVVAESRSEAFKPGDEVIVYGFDLGMNTSGGFGQYIRVPADWIMPLPAGLTLRQSMIYGTAGCTAAMSVQALAKHGVEPDQGKIVVTGATGGVGSIALAILAKAGYQTVAVTGKPTAGEYLESLGATEVAGREEVTDSSGRPLLSSRWAGAIDSVGGEMLATILKSTRYGGAVTCCGLVASAELSTTVLPFILRGISLIGIDSVNTPMEIRKAIWQRLATDWFLPQLELIATECKLIDLSDEVDRILLGKQRGRILVNLTDA